MGRSKKSVIEEISRKMWFQFGEEWKNKINEISRLENYRTYKPAIAVEDYVKLKFISHLDRQNMAKLRSGTLPIEIEKGWYRKKPRAERW